ncbi:MAG: hypothetical protein SPM02_08050 [Bacteroidales bacterium]|nr:hypothetical protein [Bacteroidales bacterium]
MKKALLLLAAVVTLMAAQAQQKHIEPYWHGFYGVAGYDFATNVNKTAFSDKATFHGFYAVGGWQIRKESGIGLGVEFLKDPSGAFNQLPVFIELRTHYLRSQLTPFSTVYVGYSIPLGSTSGGQNAIKISEGGVIWGLNVGARYAFNRNLCVNAYVGYMGMHLDGVSRWENGELTTRRPLLLQNIKAGVSVSYFLKH